MTTPAELDAVFGPGTSHDVRERALASERIYVRSQMQIAEDSPAATGRRMTSVEALDAFGYETLLTIAYDGKAVLYKTSQEPSRTLKMRREALGLSAEALAMRASITVEEVDRAETVGVISPYRILEAIAAAMDLDTLTLGVIR